MTVFVCEVCAPRRVRLRGAIRFTPMGWTAVGGWKKEKREATQNKTRYRRTDGQRHFAVLASITQAVRRRQRELIGARRHRGGCCRRELDRRLRAPNFSRRRRAEAVC